MVSAHMDEVGYEVKSVSPQGYLYFDQIGGATIACLPGRRVLVKGEKGVVKGVVGIRAGHLLTPEQIAKAHVDICVGSREEAEALGIHAGAQIVPDSPLESIGPDGDYICTRAADCRALCAVIIETLKELKAEDIHGEVVAAFNIIEETTVKGIAAASTACSWIPSPAAMFPMSISARSCPLPSRRAPSCCTASCSWVWACAPAAIPSSLRPSATRPKRPVPITRNSPLTVPVMSPMP